jgi:site-specific DNA recombinase
VDGRLSAAWLRREGPEAGVNEVEAEAVRYIFRRYQELRSVRLLKEHLDAAVIVSKHRLASDGRPYGSKPMARGALYHMLQNRIYRGEIVHKNQAYPGEHTPIIHHDLWQEVQKALAANRVDRGAGEGNNHLSLLAGLIYDAHGEPMTPSHGKEGCPISILRLQVADDWRR